ncbi:amino acid permease [Streptomyces sp. CA-132043]|uniref:amino acid permease n=1 Tax=Streptomyces sp. CA-132043 TaxID=3240048 RepID=UPI003D94204C
MPSAPPRPGAALRPRHLTMLGLGGAIGSGLFVGSGLGISGAGPAVLLCYVLAGALTVLVMRMLGELASASPDGGSFSVYAARAFGRGAGFTVGWLHWWTLCVAVAAESTASSGILHSWCPAVPAWGFALVVMVFFTGLNLTAVGMFGEFEFWFAGIKVAAVVLFLAVGSLAVCGALPGVRAPGMANLTGHGGFLPHGWVAVAAGFTSVLASFGGMEVVTIAAAETADPAASVARAVRSTVWRILLFFVGSVALIVMLVPWDSAAVGRGPFSATLDRLGMAGAGPVMDAVVLLALLSALNANLYGAARMVRSLAARGEAPRALAAGSPGGTPRVAVLLSSGVGFGAVLLGLWQPDTVFRFLVQSVGATMLYVWLAIAGSHVRLRGRGADRTDPASVRMWGSPWLPRAVVAFLAGTLVLMALTPGSRPQMLTTTALTAALATVAGLRALHARRRSSRIAPTGPAVPPAGPAPAAVAPAAQRTEETPAAG